jgi:predicted ATPase
LAVKDEILESQDTTFYYFHYDFKEEERTFVQQPVIDEDGFFDEWPDGFFDETEKNLERIL